MSNGRPNNAREIVKESYYPATWVRYIQWLGGRETLLIAISMLPVNLWSATQIPRRMYDVKVDFDRRPRIGRQPKMNLKSD